MNDLDIDGLYYLKRNMKTFLILFLRILYIRKQKMHSSQREH